MTTNNTIFDNDFQLVDSDLEFDYQKDLTAKLDKNTASFDQEIINEIILWKVYRYAKVDSNTLNLINDIDAEAKDLDEEKTATVLMALIQTKGIQLPLASTILRFRNKNVYQIIDQRVFRIIYKDKKLKIKTHLNEKNLKEQVQLYIQYLKDLKKVCTQINIPFDKLDRILFNADRRINYKQKLDNY